MHAMTILFLAIGLAVGWKGGAFVAAFGEMYYGERVSYSVRRALTGIIRFVFLFAATGGAFFLSKI